MHLISEVRERTLRGRLIIQNRRLADRNAALERMLASQQASAAAFRNSLLASVASQLEGFAAAQSQSMRSDLDAVRNELDGDAAWRAERATSSAKVQDGALEALRSVTTELSSEGADLATDAADRSAVRPPRALCD